MSQYGIAIDFEVSCDEIIDIGALCFELRSGRYISEFHRFVKPDANSLDQSVSDLTGITMQDLRLAETLQSVLAAFSTWQSNYPDRIICTWSNHDLGIFLKNECERKGISYPTYLRHWCDLQKKIGQMALDDALRKFGVSPSGRPHTAISDAKALADLTVKVAKFYTIQRTDSL